MVINEEEEIEENMNASKSLNESSATDKQNDPKLSNFDRKTFAKTITQLNRTMIENENLKEKIDLQEFHYLQAKPNLMEWHVDQEQDLGKRAS